MRYSGAVKTDSLFKALHLNYMNRRNAVLSVMKIIFLSLYIV